MLKLLLILSFVAFIQTKAIWENSDDSEWNDFKIKYRKVYEKKEDEQIRKDNYFSNKKKIETHNSLYNKTFSWKASINEYSDMSSEDFSFLMNGFISQIKKPSGEIFEATDGFVYPSELDYREKGFVTEVKNQGECGSCWAFTATGAIEGQLFKTKNTLVSLSEQNLIDCSKNHKNRGCRGGAISSSFEYIKDNQGIDTEGSYPYEGKDDKECRYKKENKGAGNNGYVDIKWRSDRSLLQALVQKGPISVSIFADEEFMYYSSGIFESEGCRLLGLNRAMLLVGYGVDKETGKKYWLLKNSLGTSWGEDGYIRLSREHQNNCGISSMASFPKI